MNTKLQEAINLAQQLGISYTPSGKRHFFDLGIVKVRGNSVFARLTFIDGSKLELSAGQTTINHHNTTAEGLIATLNFYSSTEICLN